MNRVSFSRKGSTGSEYTSLSPDYSPENTITPISGNAILNQSVDKYFETANQVNPVASTTSDSTNLNGKNANDNTIAESPTNIGEFGKNN